MNYSTVLALGLAGQVFKIVLCVVGRPRDAARSEGV